METVANSRLGQDLAVSLYKRSSHRYFPLTEISDNCYGKYRDCRLEPAQIEGSQES